MRNATPPCLDTFCRLDRLGLTVTAQLVEPDHTVLRCRPTTPASSCPGCAGPGVRHGVEQLRRGYEEWEQALHARADAWTRHREMAAFVDEVERAIGEEGHPFVEWARGHLAAVDPRRVLPSGAVPTWTHEERARHGRYEPKPTYRW